MQKILVIGCSGSGKSTFSQRLHKKLGLPLIHLDHHYWKPGWVRPDDTAETLATRVNEKERAWQAFVLNLVVQNEIWLDSRGRVLMSDRAVLLRL